MIVKNRTLVRSVVCGIAIGAVAFSTQARADGGAPAMQLATGQFITPTAPRGAVQQFLNPGLAAYPDFIAGEAVRSRLSPDGSTLAVICAGQNSLYKPDGTLDTPASTQYIFIYDVSGSHRESPVLTQVIPQTNSHVGLAFSPDGGTLYAAGGRDDSIYAYTKATGSWALASTIALGHANKGVGVGVSPNASGLAVSADGKTLVVANNYNDSISVIDTATATVRYEHDLRPFFAGNEGTDGGIGGTFPFAVAIKGNTAYVSSDRDRQVVAIDISSLMAGRLVARIPLDGNGLGLTLSQHGGHLFVAEDNADQVAVIDTNVNRVVAKIDARGPANLLSSDRDDHGHDFDRDYDDPPRRNRLTGAATFAVTLSPDGKTLYAVNAGSNSIAVIPLHGKDAYRVAGLIPTAYEPHDITFSANGRTMYIVNGKSVTGANPGHLASNTAAITFFMYPGGNTLAAALARATNQYQFQLERASLVSAPVPEDWELDRLTRKVAENNFYNSDLDDHDQRVVRFLRNHIKHVIYIVKENRTFDQILGDLTNGANADDTLVQFPEPITPNFHNLARQFVTLDNFKDPGDGSMDGWSWALRAA